MATTFDVNRIGGGTFELVQDPSTGQYSYKKVGFTPVKSLTIPDLKNSKSLLFLTLSIYFGFLITSKTYYTYWFLIFGLVGIIYLLDKYDETNREKVEDKEDIESNKETNKIRHMVLQAQHILSIIVGILTLLGFTTYMGYKKFEYKDKFSYLTLLFGKPNCGGIQQPFPGYFNSLKYAFTY